MLRIDTSQLDRGESRLFLDYLGAAIREGDHPQTGSAGFEDDGSLVVELDATLERGEQELPVTWIVRRKPDGAIPFVEVTSQDEGEMNPGWKEVAEGFISEVLHSTLARDTETFFHRNFFCYVGPRLDGEYWFQGVRIGPYPPEDTGGKMWGHCEQTVLVDQVVEGIDRKHSGRVAFERAQRFASRVSLLLGFGLFRPLPEFRWVQRIDDEGDRKSERCLLGNFPPVGQRNSMPENGEEAEPGEFSGTITEPASYPFPTLCFPNESSLLLKRLGSAPVRVEEGFDRCARLYQVGLVIGRRFPTAGLAYAVAAVDALSDAVRDNNGFKEFVHENLDLDPEGEELVNRLWGRLRSAHFHGGQFRLGDYEGRSMDLTDVNRFETQRKYGLSHHLLRSAIMAWVFRTLVRPD